MECTRPNPPRGVIGRTSSDLHPPPFSRLYRHPKSATDGDGRGTFGEHSPTPAYEQCRHQVGNNAKFWLSLISLTVLLSCPLFTWKLESDYNAPVKWKVELLN